ncbi:phosphatase PAP2 family protein [Streptomyces sp. SID5785]|nr:phosphatase PAP2 family protein [Streptomyces sp. SID5785]
MGTIDSDLYRDITSFAHDTPSWFQDLMEVWTELGLLLFAVLFVAAWWRARRGDPRALAVAVLAPLGTAVAYVASELIKSGIDEERPCRAVSGALPSLIDCPAYGDWSFPSNHATIAAGAAVGLALAWRRIGLLTVPMALMMAFSRVFVGVHYPHDVAAGLLLGTVVALLVVGMGGRPGARVALAMRGSRNGVVRWFAGPGQAASTPPRSSYGATPQTRAPSPYPAQPAPWAQEPAAQQAWPQEPYPGQAVPGGQEPYPGQAVPGGQEPPYPGQAASPAQEPPYPGRQDWGREQHRR